MIVMGDFNADFKKRFGKELLNFCNEQSLYPSDLLIHGIDSDWYTYVSEAHGTTSWIDHIVCTGSAQPHVTNCSALDNISFCDHIPLQLVYNVGDYVPNMFTSSIHPDRNTFCYLE